MKSFQEYVVENRYPLDVSGPNQLAKRAAIRDIMDALPNADEYQLRQILMILGTPARVFEKPKPRLLDASPAEAFEKIKHRRTLDVFDKNQ